jgi:hypothetical protein
MHDHPVLSRTAVLVDGVLHAPGCDASHGGCHFRWLAGRPHSSPRSSGHSTSLSATELRGRVQKAMEAMTSRASNTSTHSNPLRKPWRLMWLQFSHGSCAAGQVQQPRREGCPAAIMVQGRSRSCTPRSRRQPVLPLRPLGSMCRGTPCKPRGSKSASRCAAKLVPCPNCCSCATCVKERLWSAAEAQSSWQHADDPKPMCCAFGLRRLD